ncbi:MAG: tetratricopeptide repeat protein [Novosphingobium sp.]|nr:tetratricopeptide repeat protein [Novosphingobium sp.]MCP5402213.1 tetratricopeptide repeat protein [Novosphingobium sp.]
MTQYAKRTLSGGRIALLIAALVLAGVVAFSIYRGDETQEAEQAVAEGDAGASIEALVQAAESNPDDAEAWAKLGEAYFQAGRFAQAADAYDKATANDAQQAILWSALGEARVMASQTDPMPAVAVTAFERALSLDSDDPRARYFLAVKKDLGGDHAGAIADWLGLLKDTPADAPWRSDLVRTIEQVGKINGIEVAERIAEAGGNPPAPSMPMAAQAIPGPSAQELSAAASIPPSEQREMAEGMVSRLETRLKGDPDNVDGWVMLMRSRMTLGQPDRAARALKDAVAANPGRAAELRRQADLLGIR